MIKNNDVIEKNYIKYGNATFDVRGWTAYADAAGTVPVNGDGGSPTVTITTTTTTPLSGGRSYLLTKDASDRQGEGVSYSSFSIDSADCYKMLTLKLDYLIASGTYADGDVTVWVYDVTNAAIISVDAYQLKNVVGNGCHKALFQSTGSTSYRLILHVSSTSASAYTIKFDNVSVSPQVITYGALVSDWVSYTPANGLWTSNITNTGKWRRIGDSMQIYAKVECSAAPGPGGATTCSIKIPTGYEIDTTKLVGTSSYEALGTCIAHDGASRYEGITRYATSTDVRFIIGNATVTDSGPFAFGAGDGVYCEFIVPILGWGTSTSISGVDAADGRLVAAKYDLTSASANLSLAGSDAVEILDYNSKIIDTHNAVTTGSSWKFTCPVAGIYRCSANFRINSPADGDALALLVYKNGSNASELFVSTAASTARNICVGATLVLCNAGDYLDFRGSQNNASAKTISDGTLNYTCCIERLPSTTSISSGETVACSYGDAAGQDIGNSATVLGYDTKYYDTHGMKSGTGTSTKFYVPISGTYLVSSCFRLDSHALLAGEYTIIKILRDGSVVSSSPIIHVDANITKYWGAHVCSIIKCLAGQYITISGVQTHAATLASAADEIYNYVNIERIGT